MYNVEKYITDCVNSILTQILDIDEIIIIDDGSTDNSYKICKDIVQDKQNVVILQQENKGLGATRNYGMDIAKGDYILFVDSDDMLKENTLFDLRKIVEANSIDMLFFGADILVECDYKCSKDQYERSNIMMNTIVSGKDMFVVLYPRRYMPSACLSLDRREFLLEEQLRFPEGILHEDNLFTFEAIMQAKKVLCLKERYYIRRYRPNSIMVSGLSYERWFGMLSGSIDTWKYLKNNWHTISQKSELLKAVMSYGFNMLKSVIEKSEPVFFEMSGYLMEYVICEFLKIWNLYYKSNIDSFIKWKGSLYLYNIFERNRKMNLNKEMSLIISNYSMIVKKYQNCIKQKIILLPLNKKGLRVGIYGIGKHTQELLIQYNNLIESIKCDYFFIDSYIEDGKKIYLGKPVINVSQIKDITDIIIISSFVYMEEINNKINEVLGYDFPRICLYDEKDICSYFG